MQTLGDLYWHSKTIPFDSLVEIVSDVPMVELIHDIDDYIFSWVGIALKYNRKNIKPKYLDEELVDMVKNNLSHFETTSTSNYILSVQMVAFLDRYTAVDTFLIKIRFKLISKDTTTKHVAEKSYEF